MPSISKPILLSIVCCVVIILFLYFSTSPFAKVDDDNDNNDNSNEESIEDKQQQSAASSSSGSTGNSNRNSRSSSSPKKMPATKVLFTSCPRKVIRKQEFRRHLPDISVLPGFEIGGSFSPLFTKEEAPHCYTIDHDTKENLVAKYKKMGVPHLVNMKHVDIVFNSFTIHGKSLKELILNTTGGKKLSWGVSSHVLEHMTDLIGFLNDVADVTTDDAVFVNAVPDKRKTFDYPRPLKTYDSLIEDHEHKRERHTEKVIAEYFDMIRHRFKHTRFHNDTERDAALADHRDGKYVDVHNLVVSPIHFLSIVNKLRNNGLLKWHVGYFQADFVHEFWIVFSKKPNPFYENLNQRALEKIAKLENKQQNLHEKCMTTAFFDWARNQK